MRVYFAVRKTWVVLPHASHRGQPKAQKITSQLAKTWNHLRSLFVRSSQVRIDNTTTCLLSMISKLPLEETLGRSPFRMRSARPVASRQLLQATVGERGAARRGGRSKLQTESMARDTAANTRSTISYERVDSSRARCHKAGK